MAHFLIIHPNGTIVSFTFSSIHSTVLSDFNLERKYAGVWM